MKTKLFFLSVFLFSAYIGVNAENLVIKMTEDSGVEILNDGRFDPDLKYIGYTTSGTTICVGEVDFGSGNTYFGSGVEFAADDLNAEGFLDFYLGHPDEGGLMFNDIKVKGTNANQYYRIFKYNFYPETEKIPTGKGKVYIRYRGTNGNLKKAIFYSQQIPDDDQGQEKDPVYNCLTLPAVDAVITNTPTTEARLNNDNVIGWTEDGVTAKFSNVDFKDGETYKQIALVVMYGGVNFDSNILVYIDNMDSEDNLIAEMWTGRDFGWKVYVPLVKNLTKKITGTHDVILKWTGRTDLKEVQLIEGTPWTVEDDEKPEVPEPVDVPLTENAYGMFFDGMGGYPNSTEILNGGWDNARYQADCIGYTSRGVVVKFDAVDFKDDGFTKILVKHSSDQLSLPKSNFYFYIDLPFSAEDFEDLSILDDQPKLATVPAQGTAGWGNAKKTAGEMTSGVTGVHDLYMVFDIASGANIYGIYLDTDRITSVEETSFDKVNITSSNNQIRITSEAFINNVQLYGVDGRTIESLNIVSNTVDINVDNGIYIVKVMDEKEYITVKKVIVK